jgi:hypothetical protein
MKIKGSPCPKCRVPMMLGRVIPEPPDFVLYTFMCPDCDCVKCVAVEMSTMQDNSPGVFPDEKPQRQPGRVPLIRPPSTLAQSAPPHGSLARAGACDAAEQRVPSAF